MLYLSVPQKRFAKVRGVNQVGDGDVFPDGVHPVVSHADDDRAYVVQAEHVAVGCPPPDGSIVGVSPSDSRAALTLWTAGSSSLRV